MTLPADTPIPEAPGTLVDSVPSGGTETACPWCALEEASALWPYSPGRRFALHRCRNCGLVFTVPQLSAEAIAAYYTRSYYGVGNVRFNALFESLVYWFRRRRALHLHRLRRGPGSVLDIGCGRGHFLDALRKLGWNCTGTELSETAAEHAQDRLKLDVRIGPFQAGSFPDAAFDVVYLWHVFEHIPTSRETLADIRRILRPGGLLVIAVPNIESWQARLCRYGWFHLDLPRHYVHCSTDWLLATLARLGFCVREVNHFSFEQNVYGWIQSWLNRLGLKPNLLYDLLKRRTAREVDHPLARYPVQTIVSLTAAAALLPAAIAATVIEAFFQRGGTIEVYAARDPEPSGSTH